MQRERGRAAASLVIVAAFGGMLVGTDAPKEAESAENADGKADAKEAAPPKVEIPTTEGWQSVELETAKLKLKLPPGAKVDPPDGGFDASIAGKYFRVIFEGGGEAYFANSTGGDPVDLVKKKQWYEKDASGFEGFTYEGDDAQVAKRKEGAPVGEYCETTVCAQVDGKPLCASSAGAMIDGDKITKLTDAQCLEAVAIARSIEALK